MYSVSNKLPENWKIDGFLPTCGKHLNLICYVQHEDNNHKCTHRTFFLWHWSCKVFSEKKPIKPEGRKICKLIQNIKKYSLNYNLQLPRTGSLFPPISQVAIYIQVYSLILTFWGIVILKPYYMITSFLSCAQKRFLWVRLWPQNSNQLTRCIEIPASIHFNENRKHSMTQWLWPLITTIEKCILVSSWNLLQHLKKLPQGVPEILRWQEWDGKGQTDGPMDITTTLSTALGQCFSRCCFLPFNIYALLVPQHSVVQRIVQIDLVQKLVPRGNWFLCAGDAELHPELN